MSDKYKIDDPDGMYFMTSTVVGWVDVYQTRAEAHCRQFTKIRPAEQGSYNSCLVSDAQPPSSDCKYCKQTIGFNHAGFQEVHSIGDHQGDPWTYESRREWMLELFGKVAEDLERVRNYKVWQDGNHSEWLYTNKFTQQKLDYLHDNPVVDEIVDKPEDYLYSSARDYYCRRKGFLGCVVYLNDNLPTGLMLTKQG